SQRPAQAAAIADDLSAFLEGKPPVAKPPSAPTSDPRARARDSVREREEKRERGENTGRKGPRETWIRRLWPVGLGAIVALGSLALLAPARPKNTAAVAVPE